MIFGFLFLLLCNRLPLHRFVSISLPEPSVTFQLITLLQSIICAVRLDLHFRILSAANTGHWFSPLDCTTGTPTTQFSGRANRNTAFRTNIDGHPITWSKQTRQRAASSKQERLLSQVKSLLPIRLIRISLGKDYGAIVRVRHELSIHTKLTLPTCWHLRVMQFSTLRHICPFLPSLPSLNLAAALFADSYPFEDVSPYV